MLTEYLSFKYFKYQGRHRKAVTNKFWDTRSCMIIEVSDLEKEYSQEIV